MKYVQNILTLNLRTLTIYLFFIEIHLFDGYVKMQFFVNYLFKIYRFLFIVVFNTFFTCKLYLKCIFFAYMLDLMQI